MKENDPVTYFAETDHRRKVPFGIKASDRAKHMYVIGKTGMGKSTLLENMAIQDIQAGNGMAFVDPHGKTAELLLEYVPKERLKDVIYFAPFDMENPMSFNIMEDVGYDKRHLVANGLMSAFKKIWVDAWSARMEYILSNVIMALLEFPDSTLLGVNRMLTDKGYRKAVVDNIKDPSVRSFWVDEYAKYTDRYTQDATPAIQNKVGQFTANPLIRNIIGQPKSSFDLRDVMDSKKILIINLSKGRIGEGNANLLGSMIITKLYLAAMSRADLTDRELNKRPNFYLYVDEFQSFANESFADILSEARKYKLNLTIAHQYIEQMPEEVRSAVFGNVGTMITFRVGAYDAEVLEKEFAPKFYAEDLVNLGFTQVYLKLMIDGVSSQPFSATTLPPIQSAESDYINEVIGASRSLYTKPRIEVQDNIDTWYGKDFTPKKPEKPKRPDGVLSPFEQAHAEAKKQAAQKEAEAKNPVKSKQQVSSVPVSEKLKVVSVPDKKEEGRRVVPERRNEERQTVERRDSNEPQRREEPRNSESHMPKPVAEALINKIPPVKEKTATTRSKSAYDLKKEAAIKAIEEEKKNTNSLQDALALLLKKEKSPEAEVKDSKPKPMPKPEPRKKLAPAPPVIIPEEKQKQSQEIKSKQQVVPVTVSEKKEEGRRDKPERRDGERRDMNMPERREEPRTLTPGGLSTTHEIQQTVSQQITQNNVSVHNTVHTNTPSEKMHLQHEEKQHDINKSKQIESLQNIQKHEGEQKKVYTNTPKLRTPEVQKPIIEDVDYTPGEKTSERAQEVPEEVLKKVLGI